jgi:hypothetical protein
MLLLGAFRSHLRADNEFSINLWKAVNIEEYNRWDLIGLWMFIRASKKKQYVDISE